MMMTAASKSLLPCLLLLVLGSSTLAQANDGDVKVGDVICVEGYVMDYFCIANVVLLDNPGVKTLNGPDQHSVHCLVDVSVCVDSSFEILTDPEEPDGSGIYGRGWRVTSDSQDILIDTARSVGKQCSTCSGGPEGQANGFRAVMNATVESLPTDSVPATIAIHSAYPSNNKLSDDRQSYVLVADNPCQEFFGKDQADPPAVIDGDPESSTSRQRSSLVIFTLFFSWFMCYTSFH